jgi:hypothetical protein
MTERERLRRVTTSSERCGASTKLIRDRMVPYHPRKVDTAPGWSSILWRPGYCTVWCDGRRDAITQK